MPTAENLFETISCPLCGADEYDVVHTASYPPEISEADIQKLYSASSAHMLTDQVVRCRSCTLQYVNPRPDPKIILSSYEGAVDPTFVEQNANRIHTFRKVLSRTLRSIGQHNGNGRRVLDIGCAGGAFLVAARDLGFDPVGVEPSRWLADYGRRTYNIDVRDGILQAGMFPDSSMDLVTMWDVIEHVPQPAEVMSVIHRLLKPNGLFLLCFPDVGSTVARLMGRRWPFWLSVHLLYYTRTTMGEQLRRAGFEPLRFAPLFQQLQLGYVLQRAIPYFRPAALAVPVANKTGASKLAVTYNMGQTLVLCRKQQ